MIGRTHLLIGLGVGLSLSIALHVQPAQGLLMTAAAGIGSLAPDIDTPNSTISNKARPLRLLTFWIPHRTLTHSVFAVLSTVLLMVFGVAGLAFSAGYASHVAADMLTTKGIPLFYPFWSRSLHILPYPLRITTGGMLESFLAVILFIGNFGLLLQFLGVDVLTVIRTL